jgi:hypothetical protein
MGTASDFGGGTDLDLTAETRRQMRELREAGTRRHRLVRGTPEHEAALAAEEELQIRFWRWVRAADAKS